MRIRSLVLPAVAAAVVLFGPLLGYEAAVHAASSKPRSRHVYRLDYAVTINEPGRAVVTDSYALNVEEDSSAEVHAGANVPLQSGPSPMASPRQDVGIRLHCQLSRAGGDLLLHSNTELSTLEPRADEGPHAIHKITATGDVVVTPGTSALVTSIEEPVSHARYEVTVTATKLR